MHWIFWAFGAACLLYYIACVRYAGFGASYIWVWLAGGAGLWLLGGGLLLARYLGSEPPAWLWAVCGVLAGTAALALGALLRQIYHGMREVPAPGLDALVVLGARVKGQIPTRALRQRLERARQYLEENPETVAVLSGGQGIDEEISEAEAMYRYLVQRGIPPERLLREDRSTTTRENLLYSAKLIPEARRVGIVTSDFHVARGLGIARRLGYPQVWGAPAPADSVLRLHYLLRESFALLRENVAALRQGAERNGGRKA